MPGLRFALWAFAAGALIPVMGVLNARLGRSMAEPVHASVVLFSVALAIAVVLSLVLTGGLPTPASLRGAPLPDRFAGAILAFYAFSITFLAPRFGIGNSILFAVSAQIVTSAALDHFGLFGAPHRPVGVLRLGGLVLMIIGLAIAQVAARNTPPAP